MPFSEPIKSQILRFRKHLAQIRRAATSSSLVAPELYGSNLTNELESNGMEEAAKLPQEWVQSKPRTITEMRNGETGYVNFAYLEVLSDRTCFLPRDCKLRESKTEATISVRRDDDGKIGIRIPADATFRFRTVNALNFPESLEPVHRLSSKVGRRVSRERVMREPYSQLFLVRRLKSGRLAWRLTLIVNATRSRSCAIAV